VKEDDVEIGAEIKKNYDLSTVASLNERGIAGKKRSGVRNCRSKRSEARKRYFVP
jgi:hypothetical protein